MLRIETHRGEGGVQFLVSNYRMYVSWNVLTTMIHTLCKHCFSSLKLVRVMCFGLPKGKEVDRESTSYDLFISRLCSVKNLPLSDGLVSVCVCVSIRPWEIFMKACTFMFMVVNGHQGG